MTLKIKNKLSAIYPEHQSMFSQLKTVPKLHARDASLAEGVVRVVVGQMLSGAAARTIYQRLVEKYTHQKLLGSWQLDHASLRECGLSTSKANTIVSFGARVGHDPDALNHWYGLSRDELLQEIKSNKGMGDWTASIVALHYIGHEDIFPMGDGSLKKAINLLTERGKILTKNYVFDPELAAPYRSYLAIYLWQALDSGLLN